MLPTIGVLVAFVVIFALRLRNVDFSLSILAGSVVLVVTSGAPPMTFVDAAYATLSDPATINLAAAVAIISVLGYALKETGLMVELIDGLKSVLPSRVLLALIPAMFGLLSMPGGALMSAPFNDPEANRLGLRPEHKTYINVWFRHVWYWASPISPVPILAASLAGISLNDFLLAQLPIFAVVVVIGFLFSRLFIREEGGNGHDLRDYRYVLRGLSPILVTIVLSVAGVPIWAALILGVCIVFLIKKVPVRAALEMAWKGVRWDIALAVVSMLYFRQIISSTGSVATLFETVMGFGVPLLLILIAVPFLVGTISGTPTMGIGIVFPLLVPLTGPSGIQLVSLIYAGIISGYIASPLHLCLILTNSYYRSELGRVYRYLVPSAVALFAVVMVYRLALNGTIAI
jgi:integral membrane protein (TIGR00529 family)